jgi:type I restriction enzyme R subunit
VPAAFRKLDAIAVLTGPLLPAPRNATIDWSEKEQVRARMRAAIRRLLTRYGYPPDKQPAAIDLVMNQAELLTQAA